MADTWQNIFSNSIFSNFKQIPLSGDGFNAYQITNNLFVSYRPRHYEQTLSNLIVGQGGLGNVSAQLNHSLENLMHTKASRNREAGKIKDFNSFELSVNGQIVRWYQFKNKINGTPKEGIVWAKKRADKLEIFITKNLVDLFNFNYTEFDERKNHLQKTSWHEDDELILLSKGMSPKDAHQKMEETLPLAPIWMANMEEEPKSVIERVKRLKSFVKTPELVRSSYHSSLKDQKEIDEFTLWLTTHSGITVCRKQDADYREFLMNALCWFFDCYFRARGKYDKPHILPPVTFRDTNFYFVYIDGYKGVQQYCGSGIMTITVKLPPEYETARSSFANAGINLSIEGDGYRNIVYPKEDARFLRLLHKVGTIKIINFMESNASIDSEESKRYFLLHSADIKKYLGEKAYQLMQKILFTLDEGYLDWNRRERMSQNFMNYISTWLIDHIREFENYNLWQMKVIRKAGILIEQEKKNVKEELVDDELNDDKTKAQKLSEIEQRRIVKNAALRYGKRAWAEVKHALKMENLKKGQNPNKLLKRTLTIAEEKALIKLYQDFNNGFALDVLILESRSRLRSYVNSIAEYRPIFKKHLFDLFGVAEEVMLKNADEYDLKYNVKFISYVRGKGDVKGELIKYVIAQGHITQHYIYILKTIHEIESMFYQEKGYYPKSYEELLSFDPEFTEKTKITKITYKNAILLRSDKHVSLTERHSSGGGDKRLWQDFIEDEMDHSHTKIELYELILIAFQLLYNHDDLAKSLKKDRDYEFVCLHNGFDPQTGIIHKPTNLAAIGRASGLSRERPRQIASKYTQTLKGIMLGLMDVTKAVSTEKEKMGLTPLDQDKG
ncbi:MAG: hypothetical protein GY699_06575 [Desulfobacteraceae bacterium]|nr:hypothetical protein [Desulfobacteraceae bacterium]